MRRIAAKYGLSFLADTGLAVIYENPSGYAKRAVKKADVSWRAILLIFTVLGLAVLSEQMLRSRKAR